MVIGLYVTITSPVFCHRFQAEAVPSPALNLFTFSLFNSLTGCGFYRLRCSK